jgi:hypothetical protein
VTALGAGLAGELQRDLVLGRVQTLCCLDAAVVGGRAVTFGG